MNYAKIAAKEPVLQKEREPESILQSLKFTKHKFSKSRLFEHAVNEGRFGNIIQLDTTRHYSDSDREDEETFYGDDEDYYNEEIDDAWD
jgi:hypothetical protein